MNIVEQNWDLILNKMKLEYCSSNISYTTWIAPLTVYEVKDNTVYILVQLRASLEHIEEKYFFLLKSALRRITGIDLKLLFVQTMKRLFRKKRKILLRKTVLTRFMKKRT